MLHLNISELRAALLFELVVEKARQTPETQPDRAEWLGLARQMADGLSKYLLAEMPEGANGRGV